MKFINIFFLLSIVGLLPLSASYSYGQPNTFRVGIYDNAPIVYQTKDGKAHGLSIDILEYIADKEGWTLEYVFGTWPQCLERLEKGEIDIQVYIAYTKERAKKYDFTKLPMMGNWGVVYSAFGNATETILDLKGKRVALLNQGVHAIAFKQLISEFSILIDIIEVDNHHSAFQLVADKKADAAIANRVFGLSHANDYRLEATPIIFNPIEIRYAMPKGKSHELGKAIDYHLQELKADKDSFYYDTFDMAFGLRRAKVPQWLIYALIGTVSITIIFSVWLLILRKQIQQRKKAEEEIRTLRGILPICSICKNIRNDEGYYEKIEAYIHKHTGVDFSHTICHPCMKKHYPDAYNNMPAKKQT